MIPRAEWSKLTTEQKYVIIAQNKQKTKCEFCDKIGHTESKCRAFKNAIAELKKRSLRSLSLTLNLHQSKRKRERKKRDHMRRYTYIQPKPYYIINTTLCARTLHFATTVHQHRSAETRISSPTWDHLVPSPSLALKVASTSLSKVILEYWAPSPTTKEQLSTCYRSTRYRKHRSSPTIWQISHHRNWRQNIRFQSTLRK